MCPHAQCQSHCLFRPSSKPCYPKCHVKSRVEKNKAESQNLFCSHFTHQLDPHLISFQKNVPFLARVVFFFLFSSL